MKITWQLRLCYPGHGTKNVALGVYISQGNIVVTSALTIPKESATFEGVHIV